LKSTVCRKAANGENVFEGSTEVGVENGVQDGIDA